VSANNRPGFSQDSKNMHISSLLSSFGNEACAGGAGARRAAEEGAGGAAPGDLVGNLRTTFVAVFDPDAPIFDFARGFGRGSGRRAD